MLQGGQRALTRGFLMSRRRCGVSPRFFSTARLTLRAPSTVASGSGGGSAGAVYLPPHPDTVMPCADLQPSRSHQNFDLPGLAKLERKLM